MSWLQLQPQQYEVDFGWRAPTSLKPVGMDLVMKAEGRQLRLFQTWRGPVSGGFTGFRMGIHVVCSKRWGQVEEKAEVEDVIK